MSDETTVSETDEASPRRPIRSFVLRQSRVSVAQQRFYDSEMPKWGIPHQATLLDFSQQFQRQAPTIMEIGCGMGETTAAIAAAHPQNNYIGIEVHTPGVGALLKQIATRELTNLRVIQHDAVEVVRDMIPEGSLAGIHVFFPDPWHKKRHNKRRLLQGPFVQQLAKRLAPGAYLHCATDWEDYAQQMLAVLGAEPLLKNTAEAYAPRPDYRPLTKFEQRGVRLGHGVWDIVFKKVG